MFKVVYSAHVRNDNLEVNFMRNYFDASDPMSDDPRISWQALDEFIITVKKLQTRRSVEVFYGESPEQWPIEVKRCNVKTLETLRIKTKNKRAANYIWWLAKNGFSFDKIKEMYNEHKF